MISLQHHQTFGVLASCTQYVDITSVVQLQELCSSTDQALSPIILGGGSNTLFVSNPAEVWMINIKGIEIVKKRDEYVMVRVGAGENWHDFVDYCIKENLGGIENLALIPGKCGAAPIQNIGAYGVEIKDVLQSVSVVERSTGHRKEYHVSELGLGYRMSNFKGDWQGRYVIDSIVLKLSVESHHTINTSYGAILKQLSKHHIKDVSIAHVYEAVVAIRSEKLPDPKKLGNGGSFFKNPIISTEEFSKLESRYPTIPSYPITEDLVKVPAGWLIDQAGWKGQKVGNVGCYEKQALVIVNYGNATGEEVLRFSEVIQKSVKEKYGITLEREIQVV